MALSHPALHSVSPTTSRTASDTRLIRSSMKLALSHPAKASVQAPYTARARCLSAGTQRAATRPQLPVAARRQRCRAMAEKEGKQLQQEGQPQVPDTPPTPSAATQERLPAAQPSSQQVGRIPAQLITCLTTCCTGSLHSGQIACGCKPPHSVVLVFPRWMLRLPSAGAGFTCLVPSTAVAD